MKKPIEIMLFFFKEIYCTGSMCSMFKDKILNCTRKQRE